MPVAVSRIALGCALLAAGCAPLRYPPPPAPVRAVVISDLNGSYGSTDYAPAVGLAIRQITDRWRPDFVLVAGDMIAGQSARLADSTVLAMWQAFDSVVAAPLRLARIPLIVTLGNHDGSAYPSHARDRRFAIEYWRRAADAGQRAMHGDSERFPLRYTALNGDVFLVVWDATNAESGTSTELLGWLRQALGSEAARRARHRVVLGHLPLYAVAEGRNAAGAVLADADALRAQLVEWGATLFVSGHHHAYYPGRRGALELLHAGALGGGPRPLIGSRTPSPKTVSLLEFHRDSVALTTYGIDEATGALEPIPLRSLPEAVCGFNGWVVRRDHGDDADPCRRP